AAIIGKASGALAEGERAKMATALAFATRAIRAMGVGDRLDADSDRSKDVIATPAWVSSAMRSSRSALAISVRRSSASGKAVMKAVSIGTNGDTISQRVKAK